MLCANLVEIGPVVLEKKMKMWVYRRTDRETDRETERQTDRQTDDGRQVIRKAHLSFQLRWAKKESHRIRTDCGSVRSKNEEVICLRIKWKPCTVSMLICFILNEICNSLSELKCWNSGNVPAYNIVVHVDNTPFISQWNFFFDWNVMKSKTCLDHPWTLQWGKW